ncbi:MAG: transcriptional repressor [Verrucomicrobiales bacterium]|nr:transcriptional repressor [Verrucomicrobiales bacterium]
MGHHHSDCCLSDEESETIIGNIIAELRDSGMRKTEALEELLRAMLAVHKPFLLSELSEIPGLAERDQATIYRLVMKLKDLGKVRQLNFGDKGNFFQLNLADHHHDYLLCEKCGEMTEVPFSCVLKEVEQRLKTEFGWKNLSHSLAFHGLCPDCSVPD